MNAAADQLSVGIEACDCITPFGDARGTHAALVRGEIALKLTSVLGRDGGDEVPLALLGAMDETIPPRWLPDLRRLVEGIPVASWGSAKFPVIVTSSNFGASSLYAFVRDRDPAHLVHSTPFASVELLRREFGWGEHVHVFSHACVSAHLGLAHAARLLHAGIAQRALVVSYDFVSPFVAGGFHSLKILNGSFPAPYSIRETGSIGLGDGAAFAVLAKENGSMRIAAHSLHNEMFHFTGNQPDGAGFDACSSAIAAAAAGRRLWVKGHGTGTLEAGRLEAEAVTRHFPESPLVGWKGSLGHTLGSCGLVELAIALAALRAGQVPGTVGVGDATFTNSIARMAFSSTPFDGAVLASNAFGGAHAAMLLTHD